MNKTEYTYVNEHLISPSLTCPICLNILEDPHTHILCDSAFCRSCLEQLVEANCPICRCYLDIVFPIEYNAYLPKANRLIRNMLDELLVECVHCHTIRRRGQFQHECKPTTICATVKSEKWNIQHLISSTLVIFLFITCIYYNRYTVFEKAVDRRHELIRDIGIDIDKFLFDKIYYLIVNIIEYFVPVFILNLFTWLTVLFYGDRFISKSTSRLLRNIIEVFIIINLIGYSIYY